MKKLNIILVTFLLVSCFTVSVSALEVSEYIDFSAQGELLQITSLTNNFESAIIVSPGQHKSHIFTVDDSVNEIIITVISADINNIKLNVYTPDNHCYGPVSKTGINTISLKITKRDYSNFKSGKWHLDIYSSTTNDYNLSIITN